MFQSPSIICKVMNMIRKKEDHRPINECSSIGGPSSHNLQMLMSKRQDVQVADELGQWGRLSMEE